MLVFFFPFFENLGSYVYDSMRARTVLFLKGISVPRSAPTKDQVRSLFLPIVLLKMRYENVKLQMIPWGPANSICEEYD